MSYWVHVSPAALQDLRLILDRLQARSLTGTDHWIDAYQAALVTLQENPERIALAPEATKLGIALRQLLFKTRKGRFYRLVYEIIGDEVRIYRIGAPGDRPLRSGELESLT